MKTFDDLVQDYSQWRLREKGDGRLDKAEFAKLREQYAKMTGRKPVDPRTAKLRERVAAYKQWKLKSKGTAKITEGELNQLKQSILRESNTRQRSGTWETYLANYKRFKESQEPGSKITYRELKSLKENWREAQARGIRLREADDPNAMGGGNAGFDPAAGGAPMPGDPNAMAGGGMGAPVDPTISAQIQDVAQSVSALAAAAGIDMSTMNADPNAGIPPVDGMQQPGADPMGGGVPGDPNAVQQLGEAVIRYRTWKLKTKGTDKITQREFNVLKEQISKMGKPKTRYQLIQERIAARNAQLRGLQEKGLDPLTTQELANLGTPIKSNAAEQGIDKSTSESPYSSIPGASALANGYSSGKAKEETKPAKTWPTKAMGKETGGALQGAGASQTGTKVKESEECDDENEKKLDEGVKTVTEVYVDRYFEPKLNFNNLKESMKKGLLG